MLATGVAGVIVSITGLLVGTQLVDEVETGVDESLVLTEEALNALGDSIVLIREVVDTVDEALGTVRDSMDTVVLALDDAATATSGAQEFLSGSLPDTIDSVREVLTRLESVAESIDSAMRVASRAPFGPDYDPEQPFDETIADLNDTMEPLPEELRSLGEDMDGLATSADEMSTQLTQIDGELLTLDDQVEQVRTLLDRYTDTITRAQAVAAESRQDIDDRTGSTRWLLVLLALVFAAGQLVPIWLGINLRAGSDISP